MVRPVKYIIVHSSAWVESANSVRNFFFLLWDPWCTVTLIVHKSKQDWFTTLAEDWGERSLCPPSLSLLHLLIIHFCVLPDAYLYIATKGINQIYAKMLIWYPPPLSAELKRYSYPYILGAESFSVMILWLASFLILLCFLELCYKIFGLFWKLLVIQNFA